VIENDRTLAERATELARELIARKTPMIIGGSLASTSTAIAKVANAAHVVDLAMTPLASPLAHGSFVFQVNASNASSGNASKSAFEHLYRSEFGNAPNRSAFCGWDTAHLAALAVRRSGGRGEPRALAVALTTMTPYAGVTGTITLSPSRRVTTSSTTVAKPEAAGTPLTPVGAE
jgi:ABC-type branched-subunit amino acid transport system substrate-binding protein